MSPQYSVVVPWADRPELEVALRRNREILERHGAETVIVNAGGDPRSLETIVARAGVRGVRPVHLAGAPFNRSLCRNIGAVASRGEYLFLLDADIVLASDVLDQAREHLAAGGRFVAVGCIRESDPLQAAASRPNGGSAPFDRPNWSFLAERTQTTEMVTTDGRRAVLRSRMSPGKLRLGDGLVLLRKSDMLRVGGMNSRLVGWGYEDTDLQIRLQFLLALDRVELGEAVHLTHTAAARDMHAWQRNFHASTENYSRGDYVGSLDQDALRWRSQILDVPA